MATYYQKLRSGQVHTKLYSIIQATITVILEHSKYLFMFCSKGKCNKQPLKLAMFMILSLV